MSHKIVRNIPRPDAAHVKILGDLGVATVHEAQGRSGLLRPYMRQTNAMVMDRHGAITLGRDLNEAYNRLEAMEHASKITHAARVLGPVAPLPPAEVDKLQALAKKLGIPRAPDPCTLCNACPNGSGGPISYSSDEAIVDAVVRKLRGTS